MVVVSPYQGGGAVSGQGTHTSSKKDETTDREELLKKLWKALAREGLVLEEESLAVGLPSAKFIHYVGDLKPISLERIRHSEKEEQGRCQRCGEPLLVDVEELYEVGILIDNSSNETVAIFTSYEKEMLLEGKCKLIAKLSYSIGLRATKVKLVTTEKYLVGRERYKTEEAELPTPTPKTLTIIREYLQSLITGLKKGEKTAEKEQLLRRCNEVLRTVEGLIAEKVTELEKMMNHKLHEAFYPILCDDEETTKQIIEEDMEHIIQTLKERSGLEEWLNPPKCENTTQINEHTKRETICMGTLLDLHLHLEYEAVKKDEGIAITATIKPIRIPEASKQQ